jgi:dephospho-CoA kinase
VWIIGLTGAMGAGKSTMSQSFQLLGVPVLCSDTVIHTLLESDPLVSQKIKVLWPDVFVKGKIDRFLLGECALSSPDQLRILEGILYPKLAKVQKDFLELHQKQDAPLVVLDVPLLFEVGLDKYCHYVIIATAPYSLRKKRVLKRHGMSLRKFNFFESQQMPEKDRLKYADFIVPTGRGKESSLKKIQEIISFLSQQPSPSWTGEWPTVLKRELYDKRNRLRHRDNGV